MTKTKEKTTKAKKRTTKTKKKRTKITKLTNVDTKKRKEKVEKEVVNEKKENTITKGITIEYTDREKKEKLIEEIVNKIKWVKYNTEYRNFYTIINKFNMLYEQKLSKAIISRLINAYRKTDIETAIYLLDNHINKHRQELLIRFLKTIYQKNTMEVDKFIHNKFTEFKETCENKLKQQLEILQQELSL